ncbi:MAG TPA: T9SS type A sorting domain-containing protein, partial [Bacteroidales bacterium]|nr:T9SS type A sorting domain-containing protein [Bacteroidales bacterium]
GTLEFYGATDGYFHTINGGYVRNVLFNKLLSDQSGTPGPYLLDRLTGTMGDAPLTGTITLDGVADINGNVTIQSGVVSPGANSMYVEGNWTNNVGTDGFVEGSGTVVFDGASKAFIMTAESFWNLNLNKTYAAFDGLELNQPVSTGGNFNLVDGTMEINYPAGITVAGNLTIAAGAGLNANDYSGLPVTVGGNWLNNNTSYDGISGFDPGGSLVTFNGSADQTLTTACSKEDFSLLKINKPSGKFRPNNNILCYDNMEITSGGWEDNVSGLTHTFYQNFTVQTAGAFYNAFPLNTVEFTGSSNAYLKYYSGTGYFHNLFINKSSGYSVTQIGNTSCQFGGDFTLENGQYNLNGNNLFVFGNVTVNDAATLTLASGSLLVLTDTKQLNVNSGGRLESYGTAVNPVTIRANVSTYRYALNINSGGTIAADHTLFMNMGANGVYLPPGSTVDPAYAFYGCTFQDGASGGTLLGINNSQVLTIRHAVFPSNTWGGASNVAKTLNSGHVYFVDFSGGFSGESYDGDGFNLIDWVPTLTAAASATPTEICTGSSSQLHAGPAGGKTPYTYLWSPASGLSSTTVENPVASPGSTTIYSVTVTDNLGTTTTSSTPLTVRPYLPVSVSIAASANPSPPGYFVTFTATPVNGGSSPSYQWKVNGVNVGSGLSSYSYVPSYNDQVKCVVTSNYLCPTGNPATSNTIVMIVVPVNVSVTGTVPSGLNVCFDASNTVTVAGGGSTFIVQSGGSARMIAGYKIDYLYGTRVFPGGYMHGYITTTNAYCGSLSKSMVTAEGGEVTGVEIPGKCVTASGRFLLFPNPNDGRFTLLNRGASFGTAIRVEIFDMRGICVLKTAYPGDGSHSLNLVGVSPGLYFVKVSAGDTTENLKMLIGR